MLEKLKFQWLASAFGRWHSKLADRERKLVNLTTMLILVAVAYFAAWRPLSDWSELQQRRYRQQAALVEWMQANAVAARRQGQQTSQNPSAGGSLLTLVSNAASEEGIQLTRFQPEGNGGISVVLQNQNFDVLMRWLARLEQQSHVQVRQISIDRQEADGLVNARINFI